MVVRQQSLLLFSGLPVRFHLSADVGAVWSSGVSTRTSARAAARTPERAAPNARTYPHTLLKFSVLECACSRQFCGSLHTQIFQPTPLVTSTCTRYGRCTSRESCLLRKVRRRLSHSLRFGTGCQVFQSACLQDTGNVYGTDGSPTLYPCGSSAAVPSGSRTVTVVPTASVLANCSVPPCCSMMARAPNSPMPVPVVRCATLLPR
jgi:hypothetical protein